MKTESPNRKEYMGIPYVSSKNNSSFIILESLLSFDTDEDKKKVPDRMRKFSSMVRFAYKRLLEKTEEEVSNSC